MANRVIAFKDENKTYFLKGIETSYDEDKGTNFIIDKTEVFNEANLFTKGQESSIIKKLESSGYTCTMVIKPKEQAYHTALRIVLDTPSNSWMYDVKELTVRFNIVKEQTNIKEEVNYTDPEHKTRFSDVNDCFTTYYFQNRDDAKLFIFKYKEEIMSIIKNSITYTIT